MSTEANENAIVESMFGVFGQKVEDVVLKEEDGGSTLPMFKPDPTTTPNKKWLGIVKFLPNLEDLKHPTVEKVTYWMEDPTTSTGFRYESPKSLGRFEKCPVASAYHAWSKSDDARLKAQAKKLNYSKKCHALVQVVKDLQNPENNGKIFYWNLPVKIQKMINSKMYPTKEDIDMGEVEHNPFDPFIGQTMTLKIGVGEHGRDWDECSWSKPDVPTTMILEGETTPLKLSSDANELKEQQQKALQTILNGPKLSVMTYEPADDATVKKVNQILAIMAGEPVNADEPDTQGQTEKPAEQPAAQASAEQPAEKPTEQPAAQEQKADDSSFIDDVLNA